jgi:hypothetical protein
MAINYQSVISGGGGGGGVELMMRSNPMNGGARRGVDTEVRRSEE